MAVALGSGASLLRLPGWPARRFVRPQAALNLRQGIHGGVQVFQIERGADVGSDDHFGHFSYRFLDALGQGLIAR